MGAGIENIVMAVALTVWARFARMLRGDVLAIKEVGLRDLRQDSRGVDAFDNYPARIPHTINTLMVITSLQIGQVILLEASLSFLGLGLPPGDPAWGIMVSEGRSVILDVWWLALLPGLAITAVVLAFNSLATGCGIRWTRSCVGRSLDYGPLRCHPQGRHSTAGVAVGHVFLGCTLSISLTRPVLKALLAVQLVPVIYVEVPAQDHAPARLHGPELPCRVLGEVGHPGREVGVALLLQPQERVTTVPTLHPISPGGLPVGSGQAQQALDPLVPIFLALPADLQPRHTVGRVNF